MAQRVIRRMVSLLLALDNADGVMELDAACRDLGYVTPGEAAAWFRASAASGAGPGLEAEKVRERARKRVREDAERLRSLGFAIGEQRHGKPGELEYRVLLHLEERPFVPVTLDPAEVAAVVEWAAQLHLDSQGTPTLPSAAVEFGRAAETGTVLVVSRGDRSWRILPWQLLLRGERCYGVGRDLDADMVRTLRLDTADVLVTHTDDVLGPYDDSNLQAGRMTDPLTWGDEELEIRLDAPASAIDQVASALAPAALEVVRLDGQASCTITASVTDMRVVVERLLPVVEAIAIRSPQLAAEFQDVASDLVAEASWLPHRNVTPPMRTPLAARPKVDPQDPLMPPGPGAPVGDRDSTSDTGALLLALNFLSEGGGTQGIVDVSRAAGRSRRIMATLLATYLDQWLLTEGDGSSTQPFTLLAPDGGEMEAGEALSYPARVHSIEVHDDGLADIGRRRMSWQEMCRMLISALSIRDSRSQSSGTIADLDGLIHELERRLGLDADQLTILADIGPTPGELEALRTSWRRWARDDAIVQALVHREGHPPQRLVLHPIGLTGDLDLVALSARNPGRTAEWRPLRLDPRDIEDVEVLSMHSTEVGITQQDRADALRAVELTRLVTLAVRAGEPATAAALGTLTRQWDADIVGHGDCHVAMIRVQPPVDDHIGRLLVEHSSVLRVLAPSDCVALPERIARRLRAASQRSP